MFEIAGFAPSFDTGTTTTSNNFWDIFVKVVIAVVVVVVGAVIIYFSGGAAAPALISLAAKVGVVLTVKTAVVLMVAGVVAIGMSLMSCLDNVFVISNTEIYLSEVYFSTKNQNLGLQSEAHTTQINYIDGKFVSENDIGSMVIGDNGQVYYYYSTIRPADYYTNYWFVMPTLNCTDENDIKKANSGEKPQDFIKPGGYDAIEKYFYKNGIYYYLPLASQTG